MTTATVVFVLSSCYYWLHSVPVLYLHLVSWNKMMMTMTINWA